MTTYYVARCSQCIHITDDIDCLPPDVYAPVMRTSTRRYAMKHAAFMAKDHGTRHISVNVTEGLFETWRSAGDWSRSV